MAQSVIGYVLGLAVLAIIGVIAVRRYKQDHSAEELGKWLDTHHLGWMHHHKH